MIPLTSLNYKYQKCRNISYRLQLTNSNRTADQLHVVTRGQILRYVWSTSVSVTPDSHTIISHHSSVRYTIVVL